MNKLDNFTKAYIRAALWSTTDGNGDALDSNYHIYDISEDSMHAIIRDCSLFQLENAAVLALAYDRYSYHPDAPTPEHCAGHDFWLTRCGHGCGFWDRKELDGETNGSYGIGQVLSEQCEAWGECDIVVGDDFKLDFTSWKREYK